MVRQKQHRYCHISGDAFYPQSRALCPAPQKSIHQVLTTSKNTIRPHINSMSGDEAVTPSILCEISNSRIMMLLRPVTTGRTVHTCLDMHVHMGTHKQNRQSTILFSTQQQIPIRACDTNEPQRKDDSQSHDVNDDHQPP